MQVVFEQCTTSTALTNTKKWSLSQTYIYKHKKHILSALSKCYCIIINQSPYSIVGLPSYVLSHTKYIHSCFPSQFLLSPMPGTPLPLLSTQSHLIRQHSSQISFLSQSPPTYMSQPMKIVPCRKKTLTVHSTSVAVTVHHLTFKNFVPHFQLNAWVAIISKAIYWAPR